MNAKYRAQIAQVNRALYIKLDLACGGGTKGLERVEQKFHLEGVTKYSNFLQKVGFSIFFIRIKSATPVNFWHKIGELWRPNMKDTATLMTYRERNWLQFMRNYSLVMS